MSPKLHVMEPPVTMDEAGALRQAVVDRRNILVAGGIGIAPFPALAEAIISQLGIKPEVIIEKRASVHIF